MTTLYDIVKAAEAATKDADEARRQDNRVNAIFAWRERDRTIRTDFRHDLEELFFSDRTVLQDNLAKLWNMAWEEGHSEGYYRVADIYEDLAQLIISFMDNK